jgi:hypothetical protein
MNDSSKTISIGKDKDPFTFPLGLKQVSVYMQYFLLDSKRDLKSLYDTLELSAASRRRHRNSIEFRTDERERRKLSNINRGLTMELYASGMFSYFDHPSEVHANCLVSRQQSQSPADDTQFRAFPHNCAQGGLPDAVVDYKDFKVALEVSSKSKLSLAEFAEQLDNALDHVRKIRENGYDKPLYCLLINARSLALTENKHALQKLLDKIDPSEQLYVTVISIDEFAELGQFMARNHSTVFPKVSSEDLLDVLNATVKEGIHGQFHVEFRKLLINRNLTPAIRFRRV